MMGGTMTRTFKDYRDINPPRLATLQTRKVTRSQRRRPQNDYRCATLLGYWWDEDGEPIDQYYPVAKNIMGGGE